MEFERGEFRQFTDSEPADFSGIVKNELGSFWRPALSRAFADAGPPAANRRSSSPPGLRKGSRTPTAELKAKARAMREAGYSYSQIAHTLGLSKGTAWNWLHEG